MRHSKALAIFDYIMKRYGERKKFSGALSFDEAVPYYIVALLKEKLSQYKITIEYNKVLRDNRLRLDRKTLLIKRG
jgi:hypothetical protein